MDQERYDREIKALKRLARVVRTLPNFKLALAEIVEIIAELSEADIAVLYLVDLERQELVLSAAAGKVSPKPGLKIPMGKGFVGKAAQTGKVFLETVKEPSAYDLPFWTKETSSFLVLPLISEGKVLGVLDIRSTSGRQFKSDELLAPSFAQEVAALIDGGKLFNETRKSLLEHQVLYEIGLLLTSAREIQEVLEVILESAMRVISAPAGSLALYDDEQKKFVMAVQIGFSPDFALKNEWTHREGGLTDQILAETNPLVVSDVTENKACDNPVMIREGIKSLMAVALRWEKKIVGILYVDDFVPREFSSDEVSVLSLLANQATIAIMKAQLLEETQRLAITDGLTEVFNHRYFQDRLAEELRRAERYVHPLSLILVDIDNFKNYNDRFGHIRGDFVLRKTIQTVKEATREVDIVARYGGEEFIIILPETSGADAAKVAEKIRSAVEKAPFPDERTQPGKKLTISLGVATYPDDASAKDELINKTDKAMYLSKRMGKNRVSQARDLTNGRSRFAARK